MTPEALSAADDRLRVAREAAEEAGEILRGLFRKPLISRFKRGDSMVSEADQAAEEAIVKRIAGAFPSDLILGEESGLTPGDSGWSWTLDPLDGTQNFLAGVPLFAVAIAVLHDQTPVVALINDPMHGEVYTALRGRGARRNGAAIAVSREPLGASSLVAVRHRFLKREGHRMDELLPTRKFRSLGSISVELAYVAQGSIHLLIANRPHLWDVAPGMLLVEEAGGMMRSFEGDPIFPLAEDMASAAERRYQIMAGGPAAVEAAIPHLRSLA